MALTLESMRTDKRGKALDFAAFHEDVTHMDEGQLERYVKLAFRKERDTEFLPLPFWDYTFGQARGEYKPGEWFAGISITVPGAVAGTFTKNDGTKADIDQEYRSRFENVLGRIFDELLSPDIQPTKEQLQMAQHAINAVGVIIFRGGHNHPKIQFAKTLRPMDYVNPAQGLQMIRGNTLPDLATNELFRKATQMKADSRYAGLEYHFI